MKNVEHIVEACRVPLSLPEASSRLWLIRRQHVPGPPVRQFLGFAPHHDHYTLLCRASLATLHTGKDEIVMEDSPSELRRHLPILLAARGRVLVSGLGLGCVVRGLLSRTDVDHIDVIEINPWILRTVGPEFAGNPRVTLHCGDALKHRWPRDALWDFAWHDIWSDDDSLHLLHVKLIDRYRNRCARQGAWMLPRMVRRLIKKVDLL